MFAQPQFNKNKEYFFIVALLLARLFYLLYKCQVGICTLFSMNPSLQFLKYDIQDSPNLGSACYFGLSSLTKHDDRFKYYKIHPSLALQKVYNKPEEVHIYPLIIDSSFGGLLFTDELASRRSTF